MGPFIQVVGRIQLLCCCGIEVPISLLEVLLNFLGLQHPFPIFKTRNYRQSPSHTQNPSALTSLSLLCFLISCPYLSDSSLLHLHLRAHMIIKTPPLIKLQSGSSKPSYGLDFNLSLLSPFATKNSARPVYQESRYP